MKDRVRDEVIKQKARDMSRQKAAALAAKLKGAADFEAAAKAAGVEPKTTELITRDAPIPDLGIAPEVLDAAFALPVGAVSDPITTDAGTVVFKVHRERGSDAGRVGREPGPVPSGAARTIGATASSPPT